MEETGAIYAAFDAYPTYKGASTHIKHMVEALTETFQNVTVYSLGKNTTDNQDIEDRIIYEKFLPEAPNYLKRANEYTAWLSEKIHEKKIIELAHFRDVWSALAILEHPGVVHKIFEVNAFLPVELPYRYPGISQQTLKRIDQLEKQCLEESDIIICPSNVIRDNLGKRGISKEKVKVVTNGAEIPDEYIKPTGIDLPPEYIIYFGALQPWQGIDQLIKAMKYLQDYPDLKLIICSSQKLRYAKSLQKLAEKLELGDKIQWYFMLEKEVLNYLIHHALISVAPLTECSRNLEQGCSPIKIFESMSNTTAVLATDLPVTREIISDNINGKLVRPDRPAELARGIRFLLDYPELREKIAKAGREIVIESYNWDKIKLILSGIYQNILVY